MRLTDRCGDLCLHSSYFAEFSFIARYLYWLILLYLPLATTQPMPTSCAFCRAKLMQKFPTTGPRRLFPFTSAVATDSFSTTGLPSFAQIPAWISFTYKSGTRPLELDRWSGSFLNKNKVVVVTQSGYKLQDLSPLISAMLRPDVLSFFFFLTTWNIHNNDNYWEPWSTKGFSTSDRLPRLDFPVQPHCFTVTVYCSLYHDALFKFLSLIGLKVLLNPQDTFALR